MSGGPLAGLRVLDFTRMLSGPFCTLVLADLGAEVVKIEDPTVGDTSRKSGPWRPEDPEHLQSGYFHSVNRGKASLAIDLKSPEGVEIIKALVPSFDIVVENFRVGVMDRLGLSYETLRAIKPSLIYGAIRGFGDPRTGVSPYAEWPAYDVVAQAMGGMMGITGEAGGAPMKIGPGVGDIAPGLYLAVGLLSAVLHARATGEGQFVDVGMVDAALGVSERIVHQYSFGHTVPGPEGAHHPFLVPFGIYRAKDGYVTLGCPGDNFFVALCRKLDLDHMADDPTLATRPQRADRIPEIIAAVEAKTQLLTKAELAMRLGGLVPFGPVYTVEEIVADPHFAAREMLPEIEIEGLHPPVRIAGSPIKFTATPAGVRGRGPNLGEDTWSVLRAHGASETDLARWRDAGAIRKDSP